MKKVININFQGRVIPIEETAYDILKQYIESLRSYFANEEGRDEIINDIEGRIAELFSERLKKGATCITDEDVNAIMASMGRPEDFEQAEAQASDAKSSASTGSSTGQQQHQSYARPEEPRRLFRAENDKILGGVCAGLANYLRIDPAIARILFALITFGGFGLGFVLYILLWIVLPSRNMNITVRKRLYRDPENKVLGGIASGLAAYFKIDVWIPRLIFALPLIMSIVVSIFRNDWFDFDPGPVFMTGGFGGTLFIIYIILWIVLPEAVTASEKLEMRGERVDLQSIKNTIKEDLENFKTRAQTWGQEVKQTSQQLASQAAPAVKTYSSDAGSSIRGAGSGIAHAIGVLFKAFFLFIAGIIGFALLMALIGLLFGGVAFFPFKEYVLDGFWQNFFAWTGLIFFLGIPIIAFLTWLIRRLIGVKTRNNYIGYVFGTLWVFGLVSVILLGGMIARNFRTKASVKDEITVTQPASGKMLLKVSPEKVKYYGDDWFGFDMEDGPFYSISPDSILMNTVRVKLVKSPDSSYHVYSVKFSSGNNPGIAERLAGQISFPVNQSDSFLYLPKGFAVNKSQKFRNQQVLLVVEVPVGKRIELDRSLDQYQWFNINFNRRRGWNAEWDQHWDDSYFWNNNVEYVMTAKGLERTDKKDDDEEDSRDNREDTFKTTIDANGVKIKVEGKVDEKGKYRYEEKRDSRPADKTDTVKPEQEISDNDEVSDGTEEHPVEMVSPIYALIRFVR